MAENQQEARLVIVGKKPVFRYVTASITLLNRGFREVEFVARGKNIPLCVDAVELLRKSFRKDVKVKDVSIWSEEFTQNGKPRRISYIKIIVEKV
jgi:DNA-binding protein Alba